MKTPYRIAKEIGIPPSKIYRRIEQLNEELTSHVERNTDKTISVDPVGEQILIDSFKKDNERINAESNDRNIDNTTIESIKTILEQVIFQNSIDNNNNGNTKQYIEQIEFLKAELTKQTEQNRLLNTEILEQNKLLNAELAKQTEQNKLLSIKLAEQTNKIGELAKALAIINGQFLLNSDEQNKLNETIPQQPKKNFFQRLFNRW